jgi:hypothetical protein
VFVAFEKTKRLSSEDHVQVLNETKNRVKDEKGAVT